MHRAALLTLILALVPLSSPLSQDLPYGLTERTPNTSFLVSTTEAPLVEMQLRRVFSALSFSQAVFLTHAGDGSDRLFVVEKSGRIQVFPNTTGVDAAGTFLDIRSRVNAGPNEAGLLGLAFHPQYATNGKVYVSYTRGSLFSRISEFRVSQDPNAVDPATERVLLEVRQPAGNHNGGQISFGPDGFLYIALGDGGGANDVFGNGQNPGTPLGAILRIDVDRTSGALAYAIPSDNPYAGNTFGWREEIWAWGLRNPWRFSFDRITGELWAGDVGQGRWEEIDLIEKGRNYGWNRMEGFHCFSPSSGCDTTGVSMPVAEYGHDEGRSITGGYVYRGPRLARLYGVYLYGDYVTRTIWGLRYEDGEVTETRTLARSASLIASFGEDEAGEVYVVGYDGRIYVFDERPGSPTPARIPDTIAGSGLYTDAAAQTPAPGIIPYSVNAQLWSDGLHKTRHIALPGTTRIGFSRDSHWAFPPDAALVKSFYLDFEAGNADSRRIVETRFLVKRTDGEAWDGFSYQWNEEGTDAVLLDSGRTVTYTITDPAAPGGQREQAYDFPSREDCLVCHTPAAGYVLGVRTAQLNGPHTYGDTRDHQLRALNHIGLFTEDIGEEYGEFPRLEDPTDAQATLEARARSYLDANCALCHFPGGTGRTNMDLRYATPLDEAGLVDVEPTLGTLGVDGAARILPGNPERSVLYLRMLDLGEFRMPQLATSVVDQEGAAVVRRWIENLRTTPAVNAGSDFDGDGTVNFPDFLLFIGVFGSSQGTARYDPRFDLDGDRSIGFQDFLLFARDFGRRVEG